MLEIRTSCENCAIELLPNSSIAMICSFECTFCKDCVETVLENVCPNCGGGFENRPIRPKDLVEKYRAEDKSVIKPIIMEQFYPILTKYKKIRPENR
ncbi:MAG: hypothetical protein RL662_880 [Bacteroidota bacterium]|jgi:hypothetical protein